MLLFVAMVIKIAASTLCVVDGPRLAWGEPSAAGMSLVQTDTADADSDEFCLLGEGTSCHCACAHAAALPADIAVVPAMITLPMAVRHVPTAPTAHISGSPLRPPIA